MVSDSTRILSLRCEHTSSLQGNSNTRISIRVTHQASQKASSMEISLRLLRTNSSEITFEENMRNFSTRLKNRDYPATTVEKHLSEVIFADRKKALEQKNKNARKNILPFVTQYHPVLPNLQNILMGKWHLIQNQPYLRNIFKEPPLI